MIALFPVVGLAVICSKLDGNYLGIEFKGILVSLFVHIGHIGSHHGGSAAHAKVADIVFFTQH